MPTSFTIFGRINDNRRNHHTRRITGLHSIEIDQPSKNDTENDTSDASKEDDGKLHSLEGTVKIEDLIPVTAASNIKIYVKAVSAQGYTFTYDLFEGTVNQDITDFETTADISGGDYTVTDPSGSKYEP